MRSSNRRFSIFVVLFLIAAVALAGCATKTYVRTQIDPVNKKISEVENSVKENAERIDAVDRRAQTGITEARNAAAAADQRAGAAGQSAAAADQKATAAQQGVQQANNRINTVENRVRNINVEPNYTVADTQAVTFRVNSSTLSDEGKATLDRVVGQTQGQASFMLELQGYTDSTGDETYNVALSQRRVQSVLRYLIEKNVPLYRTRVVGRGESNPVGDNKTRAGREQNRRVEIRILRAQATSSN